MAASKTQYYTVDELKRLAQGGVRKGHVACWQCGHIQTDRIVKKSWGMKYEDAPVREQCARCKSPLTGLTIAPGSNS
jgi:phage terminase large subunit GpA-like protein